MPLDTTWDLNALTAALAHQLTSRSWRLATAESCTGGLIAATCTALSGSSAWFELGWVTYSNAAKTRQLGVPTDCLEAHGAVSMPVAQAMVQGALLHADAHCALSVTGIAGPTGGTPHKPVGTVCFGWAMAGRAEATEPEVWTETQWFDGDRDAVRQQATRHALRVLVEALVRNSATQT